MPCPREAAAETIVDIQAEFEPQTGNGTFVMFEQAETLVNYLISGAMQTAASPGGHADDGRTRAQWFRYAHNFKEASLNFLGALAATGFLPIPAPPPPQPLPPPLLSPIRRAPPYRAKTPRFQIRT